MKRKISPQIKLLGAMLTLAAWLPKANAQTQVGADILGHATAQYMMEACALSADAKTLVVGSPWATGSSVKKGLMRVYTWNGSAWVQKGTDILGVANNDEFGTAVDISADGLTIIGGAPNNDEGGSNAGHVRIFRWSGSAWVQKGLSIKGIAATNLMGTAVKISGDGNSVIVGTHNHTVRSTRDGVARVFTWSGTAWVQKGANLGGENQGDEFGYSVDISTNGNRIAVGAWSNDQNGSNSGHVRVFEWRTATNSWVKLGADIDGRTAGERFGTSVGLSYSGDTLIVGSPESSDSGAKAGMVRIYEFNSSLSWKQVGKNIGGEAAGDSCGFAVGISDNGRVIVVGSPRNDATIRDAGSIRIFKNLGSGWGRAETVDIDGTASGPVGTGLTAGQQFGRTVAINRYGNNRVAGGSRQGFIYKGIIRVYTTSPTYCNDGLVVWDGGGATSSYAWTDRFNWAGDKCPCEGSDILFNNTSPTKNCIVIDTIRMSSITLGTGYTGRLRLEGDSALLEVGAIILRGGGSLLVNPGTSKGVISCGNLEVTNNSSISPGINGISVAGLTYIRGGQFIARAGSTINLNNIYLDNNATFQSPQSNGIVNHSGYFRRVATTSFLGTGSIWNMNGSAVTHDFSFGTATVTTTTFNKLNINALDTFSSDNIIVTDTFRINGTSTNVVGGLFTARGRVIIGSSDNAMNKLTIGATTGNQILSCTNAGALTRTPVEVNKSTSGNLVLGSDVDFGTLTLTKGHIDPNGYKATLTSNSISGANNTSYIIGTAYVKKTDAAFSGGNIVVPVGNSSSLKAITIANNGTKNSWKVDYIGSDPSSVDSDLHGSISSISSSEYWTIQRTTADTMATSVTIPANTGTFDRVAWLDGGSWRSIGGSTSGSNITSTEANLFKPLGTYYLAAAVSGGPAPINVVNDKDVVSGFETTVEKSKVSNDIVANGNNGSLNVYPNPARANIQIVLPANAVSFHVSDMAGRLVGTYPASVRQLDLSGLNNGMYLITTEVNGTKQSIRFVKQ